MQPMAKGIKQVNPIVITARWLDEELARMRRPKPYKNPVTAPRMTRSPFLNSPVPVSVPAMPHPLSNLIIERVQFSTETSHSVKQIIEHVHLWEAWDGPLLRGGATPWRNCAPQMFRLISVYRRKSAAKGFVLI